MSLLTDKPVPNALDSSIGHDNNSGLHVSTKDNSDWAWVWQVVFATIASSLVTILELLLWATYRKIPTFDQEFLSQFNPWLQSMVIGHELDRELYLFGLVAFPLQIVVFAGCLHWAKFQIVRGMDYLALWTPGIVAGLALWFLWLNSLADWRYLFPPGAPFSEAVGWRIFWTLVLLVPISIGITSYQKCSQLNRNRLLKLTMAAVPLMLIIIFFFQWFDEYKLYAIINPHHFNSVFDANVQLYLGRPILCRGLTHQYGLYPYFLEPLFQVTGLSVRAFSFVMQLLQVAVFGFMFLGAVRYFQSVGWAVATWLSVIYLIYFQDLIHGQSLDIIYQCYPIRLIFPAILIGLLPRNDWVVGRRWWIAQAIFGLGTIWNFDTGVIVWLTWQMVVWWQCIAEAGWLRVHQWAFRALGISLTGLLFLVLECAALYGYIVLRFGEWPSLSGYMLFQSIFYKAGFMMLPMPLWHPWQVSILLYGVGLAIGVYGLLAGGASPWLRTTFGLSILGCGIFSFYNGRSHEVVFSYTTYCAILLAGAFSERSTLFFMQRSDTRGRIASWSIGGAAAISFSFFMACMVCNANIISSWLSKLNDPQVRMPLVDEEHLLLEKWGREHQELCILSVSRSSLFSLAAKRVSPVESTSLVESILVAQLQPLIDYLKEPSRKYVVVDLVDNTLNQTPSLLQALNELKPRLIETSASKSIGLLEIGSDSPTP